MPYIHFCSMATLMYYFAFMNDTAKELLGIMQRYNIECGVKT